MKKKSLNYSNLSKNQLENLKEFYVQKKIESMSHQDLKQYVLEIISHQVNDTIGEEEEMEAWKEMSDFFGEEFAIIITEIQKNSDNENNSNEEKINPQKIRLELLEKNNFNKEKKDMWND